MQQENKEEKKSCHDLCPYGNGDRPKCAPQTLDSWESELWDLLQTEYGDYGQNGNIRDFIRTQRTVAHSSGRGEGIEELKEKILELKNINHGNMMNGQFDRNYGYNEAMKEILSLLDKDLT